MSSDIESSYWPSTAEEPSARLCNFPTGSSTLRPAHQDWLLRSVVPVLRQQGSYIIEIGGLASRLGSAAFNQKLGQARADAVKSFLEQQVQMSLPDILTASYGESVSGGGVSDNDGYYRAVLFKLHKGVGVLPAPPPEVQRPPTMPKPLPKLYFGLGVKGGGIVAIGTQTLEGYLFSADDYNDQVHVEAQFLTAGPGLGGGVNVVFIMAYGSPDKRKYKGTRFEGWDFAVSLGGRWGDAVKGVSKLPAVAKLGKLIKESGKMSQILKGASKLSPGEWEKVAELIKTSREGLGVDPNASRPQLNVFDIPLAGAALEVSIYRWWGTVTVFN